LSGAGIEYRHGEAYRPDGTMRRSSVDVKSHQSAISCRKQMRAESQRLSRASHLLSSPLARRLRKSNAAGGDICPETLLAVRVDPASRTKCGPDGDSSMIGSTNCGASRRSSPTGATAAPPSWLPARACGSTSRPRPRARRASRLSVAALYKVEHAFARLGRWRRLSGCYEGTEASARVWLEVASVAYLFARLRVQPP